MSLCSDGPTAVRIPEIYLPKSPHHLIEAPSAPIALSDRLALLGNML